MSIYERTEMILGSNNIKKLKNANIALFGIGGVGSFTAEALVRAGVGKLTLVDKDIISESNINRQLIALHSTIGKLKTEVAKERFLDINKNIEIKTYNIFFDKNSETLFNFSDYDFVIDAIDTVTSKIDLICNCKKNNINIVSSMGTGNKIHPECFKITDIQKTETCPLARVMRRELKKRNILHLPVLYSDEKPIQPEIKITEGKKTVPGSISFCPSVAGLLIASYVIKNILELK